MPAPPAPGYDPLPMSTHSTGRNTASEIDGTPVRRAGAVTAVRRAGDTAAVCRAGDTAPIRHAGDVAPARRAGAMAVVRRAGDTASIRLAGDPRANFFLFTAGPRRAGP